MRLRLFFAVWPPREVCGALWHSLAPLRKSIRGVRWVPPERLHITLRFIGDASGEELARLASVADALAGVARFKAELAGAGTFPRLGSPRVYWVGVRAPALSRVRERLDRALAGEGIHPERRTFSPHLTVGRNRGGRRGGEARGSEVAFASLLPDGPAFTVAAIHLVHSELCREGPLYSNVHKVVLCRRGRGVGNGQDT